MFTVRNVWQVTEAARFWLLFSFGISFCCSYRLLQLVARRWKSLQNRELFYTAYCSPACRRTMLATQCETVMLSDLMLHKRSNMPLNARLSARLNARLDTRLGVRISK